MVSFNRVDSFEELIEDVKSQNEGTIFEYEYLAFENHREYIEFLIESDEPFYDSFVARVGRSQDVRELFGEREFMEEFLSNALDLNQGETATVQNSIGGTVSNSVELLNRLVEQDELCIELQESETDVSFLDGLKFARDILKYRRNRIVEVGSWEQVMDDIVEVYNFPGCTEEEAREEVLDVLAERRANLVESVEKFEQAFEALDSVEVSADEAESFRDGELGDETDEDEVEVHKEEGDEEPELVDVKNVLDSIPLSEIGEKAVKDQAGFLQGLVNIYDYQMLKEPSVGEFAVFEVSLPGAEDRSDEASIDDVREERDFDEEEMAQGEIFELMADFRELKESLKPDQVRMVVEIVDKKEVTVNGISFYEYEYELVEYPEDELSVEGSHPVVDLKEPIRPVNQESYVRAKTRPNVDLVVPYSESFDSSSQLDRTGEPLE